MAPLPVAAVGAAIAAVAVGAGAAIAVGVGETTSSNVHFRHQRSLNNNRPTTAKDDGPTPARGVLGRDTVILVVAVHLLGLGDKLRERGGERQRLGDSHRPVNVQFVNHDVPRHAGTGCRRGAIG
jgi:hypothetical protein